MLDGRAGPGERVRAPPADLHRAERGWTLLDDADKSGDSGTDRLGARRRVDGHFGSFALAIVGRGEGSEIDDGPVSLVGRHQPLDRLGGLSQGEDQNPPLQADPACRHGRCGRRLPGDERGRRRRRRSSRAACRRRGRHPATLVRAAPCPFGASRYTTPLSGQVSERLKEQHWKCCIRLTLYREFESRPVRWLRFPNGAASEDG
jgi:hypothetical protein